MGGTEVKEGWKEYFKRGEGGFGQKKGGIGK
jgi:hypothetical protein